ncbi:MAG: tungstate transporter permease [Deltaproteobacteria bacterium RBG_13_58_19]|nr:MAG: tungstate transporter permease [Deltaproteobacteria bacterium RBG_13_58_19]
MSSIVNGFVRAFGLIFSFDAELWRIIFLSIQVSGTALVLATVLGLPLGAWLALRRVPLKGLWISLLNTGMGLPPVAAGLFLYLFFSRSGPLGFMELLYTPGAMIIAQCLLAFPIVASLSQAAIAHVDPVIAQAALTLGATPLQESLAVIKEGRYAILAGVMAGLGRVMAEVGAIIIVGGNIAGYTRVMTTTIALETDKGNFELAIALGIILLTLSLAITLALRFFQRLGQAGSTANLWA